MYDQRERAERDYEWILASARQEALEEGREEGLEEGLEKGTIIGAIQTLQQIVGDTVSVTDELTGLAFPDVQARLTELQQRVRSRPG